MSFAITGCNSYPPVFPEEEYSNAADFNAAVFEEGVLDAQKTTYVNNITRAIPTTSRFNSWEREGFAHSEDFSAGAIESSDDRDSLPLDAQTQNCASIILKTLQPLFKSDSSKQRFQKSMERFVAMINEMHQQSKFLADEQNAKYLLFQEDHYIPQIVKGKFKMWQIGKELTSGCHARIFTAVNIATRDSGVTKLVEEKPYIGFKKSKKAQEDIEALINERNIMQYIYSQREPPIGIQNKFTTFFSFSQPHEEKWSPFSTLRSRIGGFITKKYNDGDLYFYLAKNAETPFASEVDRLRRNTNRILMVRQLIHIVAYLHSIGVIHRDIKPENILVELDENGFIRLKLCDFGSAINTKIDPIGLYTPTASYIPYDADQEILKLQNSLCRMLENPIKYGEKDKSETCKKLIQRSYQTEVFALATTLFICMYDYPPHPIYGEHTGTMCGYPNLNRFIPVIQLHPKVRKSYEENGLPNKAFDELMGVMLRKEPDRRISISEALPSFIRCFEDFLADKKFKCQLIPEHIMAQLKEESQRLQESLIKAKRDDGEEKSGDD